MLEQCNVLSRPTYLLLLLAVYGVNCEAEDNLFVEVGSLYNYVTFVETDAGRTLNKETGSIPTQTINFGYQKPEQLYFEYAYTVGDATVDYEGYSQLGRKIETQTHYELSSHRYIVGRSFVTTLVYLGYEENSRRRDIQASEITRPLGEYLKQKQGFIGIKKSIFNRKHYTLDVQFTGKMAFSSYMRVDFDGQFDPAGIHSGVDYTLTTRLILTRKLPHNWLLRLGLRHEYTEIERSETVTLTRNGQSFAGEFYQPYTEFETFSAGLSIAKLF